MSLISLFFVAIYTAMGFTLLAMVILVILFLFH